MGANSPASQKPYVCGKLSALWQKRRFATRFELLYSSRESRKRDAAIRLIPKKTRGHAALPLTACFLSLRSSQQGNGRQAARVTCRQALVLVLRPIPQNLTPLRALRFSGAPLLRALIPLCAQIHSFRVCLSAYWGQKQKASFLLLQIIVSAHENLGELSPYLSFRPSAAHGEISVINIDLYTLSPMRGENSLQWLHFSRDFSTARGFAFHSVRLPPRSARNDNARTNNF